ncbi:unnamed protein product [Ranitomeya imitator]|uniref:F-box/LRR-repeat protein 14 n=1 Tax=Ranitomeya imitator TaxID=111125 RepID=A0ABN9M9T5_9NEOB|nr:unnamed protein product [Ranitomeya imitator]
MLMREGPAMMSRSCDRDVITGPALIPTLGPEATACTAHRRQDFNGPSEGRSRARQTPAARTSPINGPVRAPAGGCLCPRTVREERSREAKQQQPPPPQDAGPPESGAGLSRDREREEARSLLAASGSTALARPRPSQGDAGMESHISCLFPELLAMIFGYLDVRDKGRAAQVCGAWRDAAYHKSVWRGTEAKLHLRRANPSLFPSLQARGIRRVQILSLRRSLSYVIQGLPDIESLNLSGCYNLTDNGLGHAFVQEIPSLRALNLSLCKQITDSSLGRIAQYLKRLEGLELGGCSNITNTGLLLIAWGLHGLKSLNLRSCRHVSDDCQKLTDLALKHIARGLQGLRVLNLSFCGGISDAGLLHLSHMGGLRSLNLRSCDNISDTGIMHLAMGSLRLSGLDVSFCDKVGDQSLAYIAQGLYGLKSLSLCSCHISDDGINRMVRQMHSLRTLNIGQCVRITDKGLELIAEHLSQLTGIDLYGCTRITKRGLERITQLPCLKVLNLGLWQMTESEKVRLISRRRGPKTSDIGGGPLSITDIWVILDTGVDMDIQIGRRLRERKSVHHLAVLPEVKPEPMQCDRTMTRVERQEYRRLNGLCF